LPALNPFASISWLQVLIFFIEIVSLQDKTLENDLLILTFADLWQNDPAILFVFDETVQRVIKDRVISYLFAD
jgi:hypothetical protein